LKETEVYYQKELMAAMASAMEVAVGVAEVVAADQAVGA